MWPPISWQPGAVAKRWKFDQNDSFVGNSAYLQIVLALFAQMMKLLTLCGMCLLIVGCATQKTASTPPPPAPAQVDPNDCLVEATLIAQDGELITLVVNQIQQKGFGFSVNLAEGDTLHAKAAPNLQSGWMLLTYRDGMNGATFSIRKLD